MSVVGWGCREHECVSDGFSGPEGVEGVETGDGGDVWNWKPSSSAARSFNGFRRFSSVQFEAVMIFRGPSLGFGGGLDRGSRVNDVDDVRFGRLGSSPCRPAASQRAAGWDGPLQVQSVVFWMLDLLGNFSFYYSSCLSLIWARESWGDRHIEASTVCSPAGCDCEQGGL